MAKEKPQLRIVEESRGGEEGKKHVSLRQLAGMQNELQNQVADTLEEGTQFIPRKLLQVLELSRSDFDGLEKFQDFCDAHGYDLRPFHAWVRKTAQGEPLYIQKTQQLLQIAFVLLCRRWEIAPESFRGIAVPALFMKGGTMNRFAEELADHLFQQR